MSTYYDKIKKQLKQQQKLWLVTGVAGFIGAHLLEALLKLGQHVVGVDNFSTGRQCNLDDVQDRVTKEAWSNFRFIEGGIEDLEFCRKTCVGVDVILHQAALGSVPRSIDDPIATNVANVTGTLNIFVVAKDAGIRRVVYASSSSVYGDDATLPKKEDRLGQPLSPYAASKRVNELYAKAFSKVYNLELIGLRYFNVFGPRQDPEGPYAAVIPRWINNLYEGKQCEIYGDGKTTRDFCYIENVVQANLLAACTSSIEAVNKSYNVAVGEQLSLEELYDILAQAVSSELKHVTVLPPAYHPFRTGDVRFSIADIEQAKEQLGYLPTHSVRQGLIETVAWFVSHGV